MADSPLGLQLIRNHRTARACYQKGLRDAKSAAWKEWISEVGNSDPWTVSRTVVKTKKSAAHYLTTIVSDGRETDSILDTLKLVLDGLVPLDTELNDMPYHTQLRISSRCPPLEAQGMQHTLTHNELGSIIKGLGPKKAPGIDRINGTIVKRVWASCPGRLLDVMSACLIEGVFPKVWKHGLLRVIPKGNDKPLNDLKAYRPITLLPSFGKILEIVIRERLMASLTAGDPKQFGFSRGLSTEHAIRACMHWREECQENLILGVFLDIAGAFDHAWWPIILASLKQRGCPASLFKIVGSYLSQRTVTIAYSGQVVEREINMGCPQGSVLGPFLWNVLFDSLLRLHLPTGCTIFAYADDALLLLSGRSRAVIETKFKQAIEIILDWGRLNRLKFAPAKTSAMWMKGNLGSNRHPTLKMNGQQVKMVEEFRYLGIVLDRRFSFLAHARSVSDRGKVFFAEIQRISRASWGLRSRAVLILYRATYVAQITYASPVWAQRLMVGSVRLALLRGQRVPLLALTGAYRTAATSGLQIIAGVLPADLEVMESAARRDLKMNGTVVYMGTTFEAPLGSGPVVLGTAFSDMREKTMDSWQQRWNSDSTGRQVYRFFPSVCERVKMTHLRLDHYTVQLITGHGEFRGKLYDLGLVSNPWCACGGGLQYAEHILWNCPIMADAREEMISSISMEAQGPANSADLLRSPASMRSFMGFVKSWTERWDLLRRPGEPPNQTF
jgi:hypothetical protein